MMHVRQTASRMVAALVVTAAGVALAHGTASADPGGHQVTYTITATSELYAEIRYMAAEPPNMTNYAENMPKYMFVSRPKVSPLVPWTFTATLASPNEWATVSASDQIPLHRSVLDSREGPDPQFHCEIVIDGHVVVSQQGGRDVSCTTRDW
jgi:hypothetical protein